MLEIRQNKEEAAPLKTKAYSFFACLLVLFSAISSFYHFGQNNYITLASLQASLAAPDPVSQPAIEAGQTVFQFRISSEIRASHLDTPDKEPPPFIGLFSALEIYVISLRQSILAKHTLPYLSRISFSELIRAPPISLS